MCEDKTETPGYVETLPSVKKPPAELFDPEFHCAVARNKAISSFDTWIADCYDAILQYFRSTALEDKRKAAIRIGQTAWEAAETDVSIGRILSAIANNWYDGIKGGREAFDWMKMNWDHSVEEVYIAKTLRHLVQADMSFTLTDKIKHLAALFCNANILWRRCDALYL